ncbi:hypothetical protein LTR53_005956 [Teratosphaeriaceae sp. CCFEE 6253]|nr:hypothetical protein LTR53_005956 [Teratosphaeriaceae sp. CCFEE 6253]
MRQSKHDRWAAYGRVGEHATATRTQPSVWEGGSPVKDRAVLRLLRQEQRTISYSGEWAEVLRDLRPGAVAGQDHEDEGERRVRSEGPPSASAPALHVGQSPQAQHGRQVSKDPIRNIATTMFLTADVRQLAEMVHGDVEKHMQWRRDAAEERKRRKGIAVGDPHKEETLHTTMDRLLNRGAEKESDYMEREVRVLMGQAIVSPNDLMAKAIPQ